jgi:ADP-ribosyl-[dinitrogen reductase] hydrolase
MKGSCLCGAVTYEATLDDLKIGHCSCRTCRKAHAAPFAPTARVPREKFRFLSGEDRLGAFESSPGRLRRFCSVCGSHVVAERPGDPHVVLRVATLDDDPGITPLIHIWKSHEVPWCSYGGDIKEFAEWPPGRA